MSIHDKIAALQAEGVAPGDHRYGELVDLLEEAEAAADNEDLDIFDQMMNEVTPAIEAVPAINAATAIDTVPAIDAADDVEDELHREYEAGTLPRYSHDGLAYYLGRQGWDSDAKYVREWSKWLFFDGNIWMVDKKMAAYSQVRKYLRSTVIDMMSEAVGDKAIAAARRSAEAILSSSGVSAVETIARSNPLSASSIEDFDKNLMLIGTPAGTVDLTTGEIREGRREDMITKAVTVAPSAAGVVPDKWLAFLDDVLDGDQEVIAFIQRALGYSLTGSVEEQKVLFFYGDGGAGKGVILNIIAKLFGDYSRKAPIETFMKRAAGHPTDLAGLADVRFVIGGEIPKGMTWNDAIIKDLSGGDELSARFMRGDFFSFTPQMTVWMQGNTKPAFRVVDGGIRRRMVLIPFPKAGVQDEDRDNRLVERMISEEGPAILRWIIDGAVAWHEVAITGKSGLAVPKKLRDETTEYLDSEDETKSFVDDEMVADPNGFVSNSDLYDRWKVWNEARGGEVMSQGQVVKDLLERGRGITKDRKAGCRGLKGVRLIDVQEKYERAAMSDDDEVSSERAL